MTADLKTCRYCGGKMSADEYEYAFDTEERAIYYVHADSTVCDRRVADPAKAKMITKLADYDEMKAPMQELKDLRAFRDRVVAIASNERADHHSIGWAIVSLVDEEQDR